MLHAARQTVVGEQRTESTGFADARKAAQAGIDCASEHEIGTQQERENFRTTVALASIGGSFFGPTSSRSTSLEV